MNNQIRTDSVSIEQPRYKILKNAARCLKCKEEIESKHRHDFRWCACGSIAVDGGKDYLRRVGEMDLIEDLSETEEIKKV